MSIGQECCSRSRILLFVSAVVGLMALAAGFTAFGFVVANQTSQQDLPTLLRADSAASGNNISLASGMVSRDIEALFVLDHMTGNLQCWMLNPNTGAIGGLFGTNVNNDLGVTKAGDADFVITTGRIDTSGRGREGNMRPGASLVYVADGNSGKVIGYGFQFDPQAIARGDDAQKGQLVVVTQGIARGAVERDQ